MGDHLKQLQNHTLDARSQFMNLPEYLRQYAFAEKMRVCSKYSRKALSCEMTGNIRELQQNLLPWWLETFAILSAEAYEDGDNDFRNGNEDEFLRIYNTIWNLEPIIYPEKAQKGEYLKCFMPSTGLLQFHLQERSWIKYYRYQAILTTGAGRANLGQQFLEKFQTPYDDFILLGLCLRILYLCTDNIPSNVLEYLLFKRFPIAAKSLVISRSEFVQKQRAFIKDSDDITLYMNSVRVSYQYPFIEYNHQLFCPLPHLLTQSTTSSLLYRLTEGNNSLRDFMGKEVLEPYLLMIISDTHVYDEVLPEQEYIGKNGSNEKSPDAIIRWGNSVLLLDSKSTVPNLGIRLFDDRSYAQHIDIIASNIIKLYNQVKKYDMFNPFKACGINEKWGIVIVLEDSYIPRAVYYRRAMEIGGFDADSEEGKYLISHIKVFGLYQIERYCNNHNNIIMGLRALDREKNYYSLSIPTVNNNAAKELGFAEIFQERIMQDVDMVIEELRNEGLL